MAADRKSWRTGGYCRLCLETDGYHPISNIPHSSVNKEAVVSLCDRRADVSTTTSGGSGYRALWGAAVLQAKEDVEHQPFNSIAYDQAVAFFVGGGAWAESRSALADCLEVHPDDIERVGRRCIAARRKLDGLPPDAGRPPQRASPLVATEPCEAHWPMDVSTELN